MRHGSPAAKARALNDRRAARDYLDIHVLLSRGTWTPQSLFAALHDHLRPTIATEEFAADLATVGDPDPENYAAYSLGPAEVARIAASFTAWAEQLRTAPDPRGRRAVLLDRGKPKRGRTRYRAQTWCPPPGAQNCDREGASFRVIAMSPTGRS